MKGSIVKNVLGYWLLLFAVILAVKFLGLPQDGMSMTKVVAIVTAVYLAIGFIRSKFYRKS